MPGKRQRLDSLFRPAIYEGVTDLPPTTNAFNRLPIELNRHVVNYLESDRDVAAFRLICQATRNAVDGDCLSFWRPRFKRRFSFQDGWSNKKLKDMYQAWTKWMRRGTGYSFHRGHNENEKAVVKVLKLLILNSFKGNVEMDEDGHPQCKNMVQISKFVLNSKMLLNDRRAPKAKRGEPEEPNPILTAIKLVCSHFLFQLQGTRHNVFAVEDSQQAVYAASGDAPLYIYGGLSSIELNHDWFLHCLNFFRYHMMNQEAATLFSAMEDLPASQKPSPWREPLKQGAYALGKHWKGTYAYLLQPELNKMRNSNITDRGFVSDLNVDEGKIQSLELNFLQQGKQRTWPRIFEERLGSLRETAGGRTKAQGRGGNFKDMRSQSIQFEGTGEDLEDEFNALGWLNPLPEQWGIPGWQRLTMMKFFVDDEDELTEDNLWAYEGVVLPGGRIILGRWWYASDEVSPYSDYNGPFILWAVDGEPEMEEDEPDSDA